MGVLANLLSNDGRVQVLIPNVERYKECFDCFSVPVVDEWVKGHLDPKSSAYRPWGGIDRDVYFSVKTVSTRKGTDVPRGFQINVYRKDDAFRNLIDSALDEAVSVILGTSAVKKRKWTYWQADISDYRWPGVLEEIIAKIIEIISAKLKGGSEG